MRRWSTTWIAVCLAGCGSSASDAAAPGPTDDPDAALDATSEEPAPDSPAPVDAAAEPDVGLVGPDAGACAPGAMTPGTTTIPLGFGGALREYVLHVPPSYAGTSAVPLVLNFHGFTMTDTGEEGFSGMDAKSDQAGFVVAYPNGIGTSWNAGACCGQAVTSNVDDVGFARAVVADVASRLCIDATRVYATGMSNGGFLSHRLGCEAADLFAAIGPVSGVMGLPDASCKPSRPMPVIHFHGTADLVVPYGGSSLWNYPSVADTIQGWVTRDGCTDAQPTDTLTQGAGTCTTYSACAGGVKVTLCTITGEGHCWPGQPACPYGAPNTDMSANDVMWDFFSAFSL